MAHPTVTPYLDLKNSSIEGTTIWPPNATNITQVYRRNEDLAKIEIAVQALIFFLAVFGNGIVLFVLLSLRKKKLSRMNMMIVHLSCADLFVAFFNVLPQLLWDVTHRFLGGAVLCKSVKYFQVVAMYASSYVLVSTAIDRYLAICHPLTTHSWTNRKMHLLVAVAWLLSLVFSIPQLVIFSFREIDPGAGVYDCWGEFHPSWTLQLYVTWFTIAIYIVPFFLLTIAYGRICYAVWRSMRGREPVKLERKSVNGVCRRLMTNRLRAKRHENGDLTSAVDAPTTERHRDDGNPRAHVRGLSRAKVKTVKLTLTVIVCYLLCWGPFFVSQMWAAWDEKAPFEGPALTIIFLLASLNSCTNPWLYLIFIDNIRPKMRTIFCRRDSSFVIIMLLASINSCTNPWIYLAFSDSLCHRWGRCRRRDDITRSPPSFDSEYRMKMSVTTAMTLDDTTLDASSYVMHDRK